MNHLYLSIWWYSMNFYFVLLDFSYLYNEVFLYWLDYCEKVTTFVVIYRSISLFSQWVISQTLFNEH